MEAINKKWNITSGLNDNKIPQMYVQDVKKNNVPIKIISQPDSGVKKYSLKITPETLNSDYVDKSILKKYYSDVDAVLNGTYTSDDALVMGSTPKIFTDIGLTKLPVTIDKRHVYSIAKTASEARAEGKYESGTNYHGL